MPPSLAIIEFDNFMSKVQQAEGLANNRAHEPEQRSEIVKGKLCLLKTNVVLKLLVLEVGVRALPRLKEAEAMSKIVGFLRFAKAFSTQSFCNFFRKDRGRKQRLDLDKIEEAGKHSVSVSPAIQNRTRGLGLGDRSLSSAEMKVMKPVAPARNFVEENKRSELDFSTHFDPFNPFIVKVWVLGLGRKAQMKLGEIPPLDLLEILLRKIREVSH